MSVTTRPPISLIPSPFFDAVNFTVKIGSAAPFCWVPTGFRTALTRILPGWLLWFELNVAPTVAPVVDTDTTVSTSLS